MLLEVLRVCRGFCARQPWMHSLGLFDLDGESIRVCKGREDYTEGY